MIDEVNGSKISVSRIFHSSYPKSKIPLKSFKKTPIDPTTYLQLETIYKGRKGKPIKFKDARPPKHDTPQLTKLEKGLAQKYAIRDPDQKKKWGSKK